MGNKEGEIYLNFFLKFSFMVVNTKLYEILGISPNSTEQEIKEAYRQKAIKIHPDKNKDDPDATQKFQELRSAYEILSNKVKRERYDKYGLEDDTYNDEETHKPNMPKASNTIHELEVSLSDLYNGKIKKLN